MGDGRWVEPGRMAPPGEASLLGYAMIVLVSTGLKKELHEYIRVHGPSCLEMGHCLSVCGLGYAVPG